MRGCSWKKCLTVVYYFHITKIMSSSWLPFLDCTSGTCWPVELMFCTFSPASVWTPRCMPCRRNRLSVPIWWTSCREATWKLCQIFRLVSFLNLLHVFFFFCFQIVFYYSLMYKRIELLKCNRTLKFPLTLNLTYIVFNGIKVGTEPYHLFIYPISTYIQQN